MGISLDAILVYVTSVGFLKRSDFLGGCTNAYRHCLFGGVAWDRGMGIGEGS